MITLFRIKKKKEEGEKKERNKNRRETRTNKTWASPLLYDECRKAPNKAAETAVLIWYYRSCSSFSPPSFVFFCRQDTRLNDLVNRIALDEIGSELTARESAALSDVEIPSYYW